LYGLTYLCRLVFIDACIDTSRSFYDLWQTLLVRRKTPNPSNPTVLLDMTCDSEEQTTQKQLQILPEDFDLQDLQSYVTDENILAYISGYLIRKISAVHN